MLKSHMFSYDELFTVCNINRPGLLQEVKKMMITVN